MKAHLFSKMSQGLLLLSALLATSCKESSNNFFVPDHEAPSLVSVTPAMVKRQKKTIRFCLLLTSM